MPTQFQKGLMDQYSGWLKNSGYSPETGNAPRYGPMRYSITPKMEAGKSMTLPENTKARGGKWEILNDSGKGYSTGHQLSPEAKLAGDNYSRLAQGLTPSFANSKSLGIVPNNDPSLKIGNGEEYDAFRKNGFFKDPNGYAGGDANFETGKITLNEGYRNSLKGTTHELAHMLGQEYHAPNDPTYAYNDNIPALGGANKHFASNYAKVNNYEQFAEGMENAVLNPKPSNVGYQLIANRFMKPVEGNDAAMWKEANNKGVNAYMSIFGGKNY
jgi:hypothetical protein